MTSTAATQMASDAAAIVAGAEALLDRSGATGIIQEFQQRADRIRQAARVAKTPFFDPERKRA